MDDYPKILPLDHLEYMRLALSLAQKSPPRRTNYRVGAVLVDEGANRILSTGFTLELPGNTHAEQCALQKYSHANDVGEEDIGKALPTQAVLYTTMEPCQTRSAGNIPCVERILRTLSHETRGIKTIYIGVKEPTTFAAANAGQSTLEQAGIVCVHVPGLEDEIIPIATAAGSDLGIENTNIKTASGVTLDETQKTLVGSVLDLFAGRPSLKKLALWDDDAVFEDNITIATGRKQFEPQWYGLQTAFSEIERLHHEVVSAGNPIGMDLKTRYVTKGVSKEQIIASRVNIFYDKDTGKISKVQDKWGGELPDSSFKNVSVEQLFSPWWWVHYGEGWAWWLWSFTWDTWWWQAMRNLNSVSVPKMVSVPKNDEEDSKRGQNTYFYLNHPIRWIRLVGVIVAFDVYPNRVIMTLDDSSGLTVEIFCRKQAHMASVVDTTVDCHGAIKLNKDYRLVDDEHLYTTNEGYKVDVKGIDLGSIVKVKGGISEFRGEKQVTLERISLIRSTTEEASAWAENTTFYQDILSQPWVVSKRRQQEAKIAAEGLAREREARKERKRRKKKIEEKREHKAKREQGHDRKKFRRDGTSEQVAEQRGQASRQEEGAKSSRRQHENRRNQST
ncbi:MAG: hypothetical protein Q9170_001594 [Blastenia crenularia]